MNKNNFNIATCPNGVANLSSSQQPTTSDRMQKANLNGTLLITTNLRDLCNLARLQSKCGMGAFHTYSDQKQDEKLRNIERLWSQQPITIQEVRRELSLCKLTVDIGSNGKGILRKGTEVGYYFVIMSNIFTMGTAITFVLSEEALKYGISETEKKLFMEIVLLTRKKHGCNHQFVGTPDIIFNFPPPPKFGILINSDQNAILMFHTIINFLQGIWNPSSMLEKLEWPSDNEIKMLKDLAMDLNRNSRMILKSKRQRQKPKRVKIGDVLPRKSNFGAPGSASALPTLTDPDKLSPSCSFAQSVSPKIGQRAIPPQYIGRELYGLGDEKVFELCTELNLTKPNIRVINMQKLKLLKDTGERERILIDSSHNVADKVLSFTRRISQAAISKIKDEKEENKKSQERIAKLERDLEEKSLKIRKMEFESDRKLCQKARRNKRREERKKRAKEAEKYPDFQPLVVTI